MARGRWMGLLAGLLGASGVAFAALGAHVAADGTATGAASRAAWASASLLHLVHAVVLFVLALAHRAAPSRAWIVAGILLGVGILAFSGSIYRAGLLGVDSAGPLAPLGGSCLILGWFGVGIGAWRAFR